METREYIESGILELYVYGLLSEAENAEVTAMAKKHPEINNEIIAIEKTLLALSSGFSPLQSVENYQKIKTRLELNPKAESAAIEMTPKRNWAQFIGWLIAVLLLAGIVFQYNQLDQTKTQLVKTEIEKAKTEKELKQSQLKITALETDLAVMKDENNTVIVLKGQTAAPESSAKIYWNKETETVYVDASGLPEPPEGMVYQVWSLKPDSSEPTNIGLLDNFKKNELHFFAIKKTIDAEAFEITLEPAGGSPTPTTEQVLVMGKL